MVKPLFVYFLYFTKKKEKKLVKMQIFQMRMGIL